jgi:membrane protease YdiL (CAAX protease family)
MERTEAFDDFIDPAYQKPEIWRLLQGLITGIAVFGVVATVLVGGANAIFGMIPMGSLMAELQQAANPTAMFLILLSFFALLYAAFAAAAWHHRDPGSLFGDRIALIYDFLRMALLSGVFLVGIGAAMLIFLPNVATRQFDTVPWLIMMAWAIPMLFIQVTAEEVAFRGYLLQQLAARFASPIIWAVIPSILFGLLHFDPTADTSIAVLTVVGATLFGLLATDLTRITGNLGAAMGYHFVNNFLGLMVVGIPGRLSGLSMFLSGFSIDDVEALRMMLVLDISVMIVIWIVARRLLQR